MLVEKRIFALPEEIRQQVYIKSLDEYRLITLSQRWRILSVGWLPQRNAWVMPAL